MMHDFFARGMSEAQQVTSVAFALIEEGTIVTTAYKCRKSRVIEAAIESVVVSIICTMTLSAKL